MIDAVAKALALWAVPYNDWDSMSDKQRESWRYAVIYALDALRNPSPEMISAGAEWIYSDRGNDPQEDAQNVWRAMINQAISDYPR